MQLDRTEIVIRQRTALELLDLSLIVLKRHFWAVVVTCSLLGLPLLLIDTWAVAWMLNEDSYLAAEHLDEPLSAMRWRHSFHLTLLYAVQFPLISLPVSVFLGNRIFYEPMPLKKLIKRLWPITFRCILVLGIMRLALVTLAMEFLIDRSVVFDWTVEFWSLVVFSSVALLIRAFWPYAPEILGLELCPLRKGRGGEITYAQRSRGLHKLLMADHMARFIGSVFFSFLLALMLLGAMSFLKGIVTGDWTWNGWFDHLCLPLTLWSVGLLMAVFRFLTYLDSRIRLEGWEIELRLRAEAERQRSARLQPSMTGELGPEPAVTA